ncbi:MAG: tetratricopeptide repeat protein [Nitrospirota bacterium]
MTGRLTSATRIAALAAVLLVTAAAYRGVFTGGFVYDDQVTVVRNPAVWSLSRAAEWITSPYAVSSDRGGKNYRPVTVASYGLDYAAWGERPAGFHATNLAIHLLVVALVYALALRLWGGDLPALTAATWMALHPINAQAVTYISARSSTLAALGVVGAVACYDRWAAARAGGDSRGPARAWLAGALGAAAFAVGAKESAAVLPLLIVAWDRARFGATSSWRASALRSVPFWIVLGAWLVVRHLVIGGMTGPGGHVPDGWMIQWAAFAARIVETAALHSVWPAGLAADYGWPFRLEAGRAVLAWLVTTVLVAGAFALARIDRRLSWCAAWFGASLLPVLALPYITRIGLYQEHRAYLAEIGVAWLAGGATALITPSAWRRPAVRAAAATLAVALVVAAAWVDHQRTWVWGDKVRLWDDVLVQYPDSAIAHNERGLQLLNDGRLDAAEREFLAALRTLPSHAYTYLMLGMVYDKRGEVGRAIEAYRSALAYRPRYVDARLRLGLAYQAAGRTDEALAEFDRALQDDPWASPARVFSAEILERRGRIEEAIRQLERVAPDDRIYDEAQVRLGGLLLKLERWAAARRLFEAFAARKPGSSAAKYYIGMTYVREGRDDLAEAALRDAVTLDPRDAEAWRELAGLAGRRSRWRDAREWAERALTIDQTHLGAHATAALAAERLGDADGAIRHYRVLAETPTGNPAAETMRAEARAAITRLSAGSGGSVQAPGAKSRS